MDSFTTYTFPSSSHTEVVVGDRSPGANALSIPLSIPLVRSRFARTPVGYAWLPDLVRHVSRLHHNPSVSTVCSGL